MARGCHAQTWNGSEFECYKKMLGADKTTDNTGLRAGFTIGRVINVFIILIFLASLISSLVVIGALTDLHRSVSTASIAMLCISETRFLLTSLPGPG